MSFLRVTTVALTTCLTVCPIWAQRGEKYAFLVGAQKYSRSSGLNPLRYAERDVEEVAAELRRSGYREENVVVLTMHRATEVDPRFFPSKANIVKELDLLLSHRQAGDTVVVALVGHGVMFQGDEESYFCPIDANLSERKNLLSLEKEVFEKLKRCRASRKLVLYDACRDDPFSKDSRTPSSVTRPTVKAPPGGLAILYACSKDERSFENEDLRHGVFTYYVLESLRGTGDLDSDGKVGVFELAHHVPRRVNDFVRSKYGTHQVPILRGDVTEFPLVDIPREPLRPEITNSIGMKLKLIPAGEFMMGSPEGEEDRGDDEYQHRVRITKPFYLGVYEVTQAEYERVMGKNPSCFSANGRRSDEVQGMDTSRFPVELVSWEDAVEFCRKLSSFPEEQRAGRVYRLPTEAEWEYACRAGTRSVFHFGDSLSSAQANFDGDYPYGGAPQGPDLGRPAPVGSYKPNVGGLYDMHGNVNEWCQDWYDPEYYKNSPVDDPSGPMTGSDRVYRGGGWNTYAMYCRSADRNFTLPDNRAYFFGFRVASVPVDASGR